MRMTVPKLLEMKQNGEKITQVTCYDYSMAKLVDAAGIHTILVGDSLGMTMQGYPDTLPVTCLLYTSPSPRDLSTSRMPSSA